MEEVGVLDEEAQRWEHDNLVEIEDCLSTITRLQGLLFRASDPARQDLVQAQGRKCVLAIAGLKYFEYKRMFEVSERGVSIIDADDAPNTYIVAPIDSVLRVLKGTLNGDSRAFSSEWARGKAKLIGARRLHDGFVFSEIFSQFARSIAKYKGI